MKPILARALRRILDASLALALLASAGAAQALYVVHGINGTDLGLDESLPVDIELDGACALEDVVFGDVTAAIPVDVGTRQVVVRLSDGVPAQCTGAVVLDTTVNVAAFETAVVVASLDLARTISLRKFTVDSGALAAGEVRVAVAHAAVAPPVDVLLKGEPGTVGRARVLDVANGAQSEPVVVPEGTYTVRIKPATGSGLLAKLDGVPAAGNTLFVAVGSLANGTFAVIAVPIAT